MMVLLVAFLHIVEYLECLLGSGRFYYDFLETALQGTVLLYRVAVFIEGSGTDTLYHASCQGWLQNVGCIHASLRIACSHNGVDLVDEDDDVGRFLQLTDESLDTVFELPTKLGSCHHGSHIELYYALVEEQSRHLLFVNELCQSFHDGALAHTRLTY